MVLCGSSHAIRQQSVELCSYAAENMPEIPLEALVISHEEIDPDNLLLADQIELVRLVTVKGKYISEEYLDVLSQLYDTKEKKLFLFGSDAFSAGLAVRAASRASGSSCISLKKSWFDSEELLVEKPVYSSNLTARFRMSKSPFCISIAKGFRGTIKQPGNKPAVCRPNLNRDFNASWIQCQKMRELRLSEGLDAAKILVAAGKGIGSKENAAALQELAELLGARLGASRPVVMNAWMDMDALLGASGSVTAPEFCLVLGASGAAAFSVGIEKSKFTAAVNTDRKASVFRLADVGICCDLQDIVSELLRLLKADQR